MGYVLLHEVLLKILILHIKSTTYVNIFYLYTESFIQKIDLEGKQNELAMCQKRSHHTKSGSGFFSLYNR